MSSVRRWTGPTVKHLNGLQMPILGMGSLHPKLEGSLKMLFCMQHCGIRLIDTSKYNGCEVQLSKVIRDSGVPRADLWVSKLSPEDYGYETAHKAFQKSCSQMEVDYLDIYMLHWPGSIPPGDPHRELRAESWRALEDLHEEGD